MNFGKTKDDYFRAEALKAATILMRLGIFEFAGRGSRVPAADAFVCAAWMSEAMSGTIFNYRRWSKAGPNPPPIAELLTCGDRWSRLPRFERLVMIQPADFSRLLPNFDVSAAKTIPYSIHRREIVVGLDVQDVHKVPVWANGVGAIMHDGLHLAYRQQHTEIHEARCPSRADVHAVHKRTG